jgi:hypothetical protein
MPAIDFSAMNILTRRGLGARGLIKSFMFFVSLDGSSLVEGQWQRMPDDSLPAHGPGKNDEHQRKKKPAPRFAQAGRNACSAQGINWCCMNA